MISDDERVMVQISTYPMDESALSCFSFVTIRKPAALCEFGEKKKTGSGWFRTIGVFTPETGSFRGT